MTAACALHQVHYSMCTAACALQRVHYTKCTAAAGAPTLNVAMGAGSGTIGI
jgi:hypothetical protein